PIKIPFIAPKVRVEYERAVALDSTNVDARIALGNYYLYAPRIGGGSLEKARAQAAAASRLNPFRGPLFEATIAERENPADAERILTTLAAAYPDSSLPVTRLAAFYASHARANDA